MTDELNPKHQARVRHVESMVISSAAAWYLRQLAVKVDGHMIPMIEIGGIDHARNQPRSYEDLFQLRVQLHKLLEDYPLEIDVRNNVPQALGTYCRSLSKRLEEMATILESEEHKPFDNRPYAYVVRDPASGAVLGARLTIADADQTRVGFEDMTGGVATTSIEPIENWPEVQSEIKALEKWAAEASVDRQ